MGEKNPCIAHDGKTDAFDVLSLVIRVDERGEVRAMTELPVDLCY